MYEGMIIRGCGFIMGVIVGCSGFIIIYIIWKYLFNKSSNKSQKDNNTKEG